MKLLITGAWRYTQNQIEQIRQLGHEIVLLQHENEDIPCDCGTIDGVICNGLFLHHPIEKFSNLKYIQLTSAGFDRVPMEYIQSHSIVINNARGVYSIPMAEFILSSVLSLYKNIEFFRSSQRSRIWQKKRDLRELFGKRVCVVGCGSVGTECAIRFSAMGCEVVGVDLMPMQKNGYKAIFPINELKNITNTSDVLILTLPLTKKTEGIIDALILESLPYGAIIVNVARGPIINFEDLLTVLSRRPDITAVLDTFVEEPLPAENQLWDMLNVVITPHNSFVGEGNSERLWSVIFENIKAFYRS